MDALCRGDWIDALLGLLDGCRRDQAFRYAGIAIQVLQYLREFDAPAMQSCKPLPCGTGSC